MDVPERKTESNFWTETRLLKFLIFVLFLAMIGITILFLQQRAAGERMDNLNSVQNNIQDIQADAEERDYVLRAEACRLEAALLLPLNDTCLDPAVQRYYVANENEGLGPLVCTILYREGIVTPEELTDCE